MKTKIFAVTVCGLAAVGGVALYASQGKNVAGEQATSVPAVAPASAAVAMAPEVRRCDLPEGYLASYAYASKVESQVFMQGMPQAVQSVVNSQATLAIEVLSKSGNDAVVLAQLVAPNEDFVKMHGSTLGNAFLLKVGTSCEIKAFARAKSTSLRTAQAQQVAMFDLFVRAPAGATEQLKYENGTGVARAEFANVAGVLTRSIRSYELSWRSQQPFHVVASGASATLNEHWLETFESVEAISGGPLLAAKSTVTVKREQGRLTKVSTASSRSEAQYEWGNLLSGTFSNDSVVGRTANVPLGEQRYVEQMKNATLEGSFATLLERVADKANIEDQWHEMAGFLNARPEEVAPFAEGLKEATFPEEAKAVSYLVLSKVVHPEAREALSSLRRDISLASGDRLRASLALVTRKDVGVELAREMRQDAFASSTGDAEADFLPRNTLLHLGVLAGTHKGDSETFEVARDAVKSQLKAAGDNSYALSPALGAAGNLSDATLLPAIEGYTRHPNRDVRVLVPKALRGYRYADTEKVWVDWLQRETSPDVMEAIFDAIHHQLANAQRNAGPEIAAAAMRHLRMKPLVLSRQSIIHLLGPLKNENREAKLLLIQQLGEEFRANSGLYSQISNYLAPQEIELGLAMMPEFAHQYGIRGRAQAEAAVRQLEAREAEEAAKPKSIVGTE